MTNHQEQRNWNVEYILQWQVSSAFLVSREANLFLVYCKKRRERTVQDFENLERSLLAGLPGTFDHLETEDDRPPSTIMSVYFHFVLSVIFLFWFCYYLCCCCYCQCFIISVAFFCNLFVLDRRFPGYLGAVAWRRSIETCSKKICKIARKTPVLETLFNIAETYSLRLGLQRY